MVNLFQGKTHPKMVNLFQGLTWDIENPNKVIIELAQKELIEVISTLRTLKTQTSHSLRQRNTPCWVLG